MKYPVISNKFDLMVDLVMNFFLQHLRILITALLAMFVLSSCAPARLPSEGGNLSLDVRRMQIDLRQQQQAVADLSERIAAYEQRLQQQEAALSDLHQEMAERAGSLGASLPPRGRGVDSRRPRSTCRPLATTLRGGTARPLTVFKLF